MLRTAFRSKKKLFAEAAFLKVEAGLTLTEYFAADPELIDAISDAVAHKIRREDRQTARIQWASLLAGARKKSGDPFEIEELTEVSPSPEQLAAREERRKQDERLAELAFIADMTARATKQNPTHVRH